MPRATYQPPAVPALRYRVRWDRIAGGIAVGAVAVALGVAAWHAIPDTDPHTVPDTTGGIGMCAAAYSNDCAAYYAGDAVPASDATPAAPASDPTPAPVLPPCEHEDSTNCYWDAGERGNGEGVSFVDVDGTAYYPDDTVTEDEASEVRTDDTTVTEPIVNEPAPLAGNGTLDDGEVADGPVAEHDEAILVCGTGASVAIDTDIHGNAWAYCEPR